MIGQQLAHYKLGRRLGRATGDQAFLAENLRGGGTVVVKLLPPDASRNAETITRCRRQARVLAELPHPNIASIFEMLVEAEHHFYVEEHVALPTLQARLAQGALTVLECCRLGRVIADALAHLHFCGIAHGQLQADRIGLSMGGKVMLFDLDLGRSDPTAGATEPTVSSRALAYLSPERLAGGSADDRSDVWSFGVVLYQTLTGKLPFEAPSLPGLMERIRSGVPAPPSSVREGVPDSVASIALECLAKDPEQRPAAEEVRSRLWLAEVDLASVGPGRSRQALSALLDRLGYRVRERLGGGGMGEVWLAEDVGLQRSVAIKSMAPQYTGGQAASRFLREARAAAKLDHPHIVPVHGIHEVDGTLFLVMRYMAGGSLRDRLTAAGDDRMPLGDVLRWGIQAAEGLQVAHDHGVIHRDIKPDNLMLDESGTLRIADFGLARLQAAATVVTGPGTVVGTVSYMSPEQASGAAVDHRTDLFSLGVTLYELITGQRPFKGGDPEGVVHAITHDTPTPIAELRGGVGRDCTAAIASMLARDADERPQSAAAAAAVLRDALRRVPDGERQSRLLARLRSLFTFRGRAR